MRVLRLASLLALVTLVGVAHSSAAGQGGPTGLHGFLLRADEPVATTFHRTPAFAWNPVPGAVKYQFQLSTSSTFRDNGILFQNAKLATPVVATTLTLPWITGSPHALYARVRAILQDGATPWSDSFGFDMTPPPAPTPLAAPAGVLRWTPVDGASAYEVWLIDTGKNLEWTRTNVLDEREFYSFHQSLSWISTVRWRVRAVRSDYFGHRINGLPASPFGPWSPIYSSTNPAMTNAPIKLASTVSDTVSNGSSTSAAHKMMPAFTWTGNETLNGKPAELYRVEIFTDKQCLNPVYYGAAVGSPSWAPRLTGTLALPESDTGVVAARSGYLGDGTESSSRTYDNSKIDPNEQLDDAKPTTDIPGDAPAAPNTSPADDDTTSTPGADAASGSSSSSTEANGALNVSAGILGPPIDLWDTDWPQGGYYWTVIPVQAVGLGAAATTVAPPGVLKGDKTIPVADSSGFHVGDSITVGVVPNVDTLTVTSVGTGTVTVSTATGFAHVVGEPVLRSGGSITYQDMELPQDVCAAGRVQHFGVSSDPTLTTAQTPFATGLSSTGRLTSAAKTRMFYGAPLIAWTPAFGAGIYEVQYSKKAYPFTPEVDPRTSKKGLMTFATSDVLPLGPGTWYYRVRGIDFNLPTGVQQMGWSDPQKLVVAKPTFKVAPAPKRKFKILP